MPTNPSANPIMKAVSVPDNAAAYKLTTLLAAAFTTLNIPRECSLLEIDLDIGSGGQELFIGNDDVSSTNWAKHIVASQIAQVFRGDSNDCPLQDVYVKLLNNVATLIGVTILYK